ncbi:MAG: DUF2268 domain-containing putative Zn-dependent protease [Chloroflexota bacterium]
MMRTITLALLVLLLGLTIVSAQDNDLEVIEVELGDNQTARLIPLYQNFDLFEQLVSNEISLRDFPRDRRFIATCAQQWFGAMSFFDLPDFEAGLRQRVLNQYRRQAERIDDSILTTISDALIASAELLPSADIDICIMPVNFGEGFISGTASSGKMLLLIGDYPDDSSAEPLSLIVAHEYHHHARDADPQTATSGTILLERVVTEGMAVMFSYLVYPEWFDEIERFEYDEQELAIWEIFEPNLRSLETETFNTFMFGERQDLPASAGYYLGFQILDAYLDNNPDVSIEEWTRLSGDQIYEASNYEPSE